MNKEAIIKTTDEEVDTLLSQYREYLIVQSKIDACSPARIERAVALARNTGRKVSEILLKKESYPEFVEIERKEALLQANLQAISDAMTFATPAIWITYKHLAYQGTSSALNTIRDLRQHCSKEGYICTKRFKFLNAHLNKKSINLSDRSQFLDSIPLLGLRSADFIIMLSEDQQFMTQWKTYEYHTIDGRVAKWENYEA
jgi:hypothetical protein